VIKVERTSSLDPLRQIGPFSSDANNLMGASFVATNRNKQSLTLDPAKPADCASLIALIQTADVLLVDNGEMRAWKSVIDNLAVPKKLVICEIDKGTGELAVQAASSLCYTQQGQHVQAPIAEMVAGYYAANGITSALFARQLNDGKGQRITVPMINAALHFSQAETLWGVHYPALDKAPAMIDYWQIMRLVAYKDGGFGFLAPLTDKQWGGFIENFPEVKEEPEYAKYILSGKWKTLPERFQSFELWLQTVVRVGSLCTYRQVEERSIAGGIPHQRVLTFAETLSHPQIVANNAIKTLQHPVLGPHNLPSSSVHFSIAQQTCIHRAAPFPNEHGPQILQSLRVD
jgi:crotonobetainyl-CoA:carnitine CoA-transferase CaiB-like acyl-CoA transferase